MRRFATLAILLVALPMLAVPARADDAIDTDRPDLATGPTPLSLGRVQVELGASRTIEDNGHLDVLGEGLLRWGVAPRVELRATLPSWDRAHTDAVGGFSSPDVSGWGDGGLGIKLGLRSPATGFALGLVCDVSIPSGEDPFRADNPSATLLLCGLAQGARRGDLSVNVGGHFAEDDNAGLLILSYGFELAPNWGSYLEGEGIFGAGAQQGIADTGLTWRLRPQTQLDLHVGIGGNGGDAGESTFTQFGFGISERW